MMAAHRDTPSRFEFIDETETLQGRSDLVSNRRLIRAHVLRDVRQKKKAIRKQSSVTGAVAQPPRSSKCPHYYTAAKDIVRGRSSAEGARSSSDSRSLFPPEGSNADYSPLRTSTTCGKQDAIQYEHPHVPKVCPQCWKPLDPLPPQDLDSNKRDIEHNRWSGLNHSKRTPEPQLFRGWLRLADDFFTAGVGFTLDPKLQSTFPLLFRQFTIFGSVLYPLEPVENQTMFGRAAVTDGESAMLHALCFVGAMHLVASKNITLSGQESHDQKILLAAMLHKSKALSLMNCVLSDPDQATTESSIITVSLFAALEAIGGDVASAAVHSHGLARMVELRGGLSALDPDVIGDIYKSDTKTAAIGLSKPLFPLTAYWKQRIDRLSSDDIRPGVVSASLAARFFDPDLMQIFHPQMLRTFGFIRHLIKYTEYAKRAKGSQHLAGYTSAEFSVAEHLLLSFPYEGHLIKTTNDQVQECTRIAALLYCNLALWTCPSYFALVKSLVMNLRQAILKIDVVLCRRCYPDLILWILFMGCVAAEGRTERFWFILRVAEVSKSMGLREWPQVKRLLVKFFYVERALEIPFVKIWDEVVLVLGHP